MEEQKTQEKSEQQLVNENKGATSTLSESITLTEDLCEMSFQPQMAPDFTQAFSDQFQNISSAEKEKTFLLTDSTTAPIANREFPHFKIDKRKIKNVK